MKKFLSLFAIFSLMYIVSPANAAPPPPPGGHILRAGPGFRRPAPPHRRIIPPPPPRGPAFIGIGFGSGYYPYYRYRHQMCWYDGFYRPCYDSSMYINIGVPVKF